jgi:glycine hydroxymethyltransferase
VAGNDDAGLSPRLDGILRRHQEFRRYVVPLCAAETPISEYVRSFMGDPIHEKYAMGGPLRIQPRNFIGAEHVLDLHQLTIELCQRSFGASYADPRPLSGTSAVTNLLMTISQPGQRIMLQTSASGGHPSMAPICQRLGLEIIDLPYDYDRFQIDSLAYKQAVEKVDFALVAPSDILYAPDFAAIGFDPATTVIYDATQTLGLIASGHLPCPLDAHPRLVISAGTHKTLPGPSAGLLMTNNMEIALTLDTELSPKFVRHSQPHHMAALCACLIEHQAIGVPYSRRIREHACLLATALEAEGLLVLQDGDRRTETHQLFVHVEESQLDGAYERAGAVGITMNQKRKPLFRDSGLRFGVQEIARYRWSPSDVERLASVLAALIAGEASLDGLRREVVALAKHNVFAEEMQVSGEAFT